MAFSDYTPSIPSVTILSVTFTGSLSTIIISASN